MYDGDLMTDPVMWLTVRCAASSSRADFAFVLWLWAADTPSGRCVCLNLPPCQSCMWWRVEGKWYTVWELFQPFLFRDDSVPQSSNWRILGPPEGGHEERSEHPRWGRHDSHFTGCFPRTYWCPPAYMQQRVRFRNSTISSISGI